jgi:AcrR family transcriptional regulator
MTDQIIKTPTRKKREMERRTAEILSVARPILLGEGFQALSMDRVAARMEYAKGTIYNHFRNKEEIVLALAHQGMQLRQALFARAVQIDRPSRIKLMGVGAACEYFVSNCFDHFRIEQLLRQENIWDKSSAESQNLIRSCEGCCIGMVASVVEDAIQAGDLQPPTGMNPQEIVFGFWALSYGSQSLAHTSPSLQASGIRNPIQAMRIHISSLCNGLGWQPIRTWQEDLQLMESVHAEFAKDFQQLVQFHQGNLS